MHNPCIYYAVPQLFKLLFYSTKAMLSVSVALDRGFTVVLYFKISIALCFIIQKNIENPISYSYFSCCVDINRNTTFIQNSLKSNHRHGKIK